MTECYKGQQIVPSLVTPLVMFDNKEYMTWMGTLESRVWHRMYRHIVRAEMSSKINKKLLEEYYKNGILAMYKTQKEIASFFGNSSDAPVSKAIKSMVEKGIIKVHVDKDSMRSIKIYEMGTHDKSVNKHETLHLYTYFNKLNAENKLAVNFPT